MLRLVALLLLVPSAPTAVWAAGLVPQDGLFFNCAFPPALEVHPFDPDLAIGACSTNGPGAFGFAIAPAAPLAFTSPSYFLNGLLDCSGSPSGTPFIGNLALEAVGSTSRGWLATSGCELAVPFDAATGADWPLLYEASPRLSVPTRRVVSGSFTTYVKTGAGESLASFPTTFTAAVVRKGGRLLVATSNLRFGGADPEFYPGTVLLFDIDDSGPTTLVAPASPPYVITSDPNPTALTLLSGGLVAVTNTGLLDVGVPPLVTGVGSIDVIDATAGALVGSFPLGQANPGGRTLAIDPTGAVAVAGSATRRSLYAVDIRGLDALPAAPIDPTLQRPSCHDVAGPTAGGLPCLRERVIADLATEIALPPAPAGSGPFSLVGEVRFGASGDFLLATSFNDDGLAVLAFDTRNLGTPHPLLPSRFGPPETLAAAVPPALLLEHAPGPMLVHADSVSGLAGAHVIWMTGVPDGAASRALLTGSLAPATGDFDADGVEDALDNCPVAANPLQEDGGGVGGAGADGVGDPCQCGDVSGDGVVGVDDWVRITRDQAALPPVLPFPAKCNVEGVAGGDPGSCDGADAARIRQALGNPSAGLPLLCGPARP